MRARRNSFTIIEVLVCLTILSLASSFVLYKGWAMLKEKRIATSQNKLASEIFLTKQLALSYQIDMDLILEQKEGKVYLTRKTETPQGTLKGVFNTPILLPEMPWVEGEGQKEIHFYGNGWIEGQF